MSLSIGAHGMKVLSLLRGHVGNMELPQMLASVWGQLKNGVVTLTIASLLKQL